MLLNYLAVRLNGPEAAGRLIRLNLVLPDTGQTAWLRVENGALSHSVERTDHGADATVTLERKTLDRLVTGGIGLEEADREGLVTGDPDIASLGSLVALLDDFNPWFAVIEP
jgi:alkyl sulfatase BDS1-like metallo-beta-lactamase superfamily hydrolase